MAYKLPRILMDTLIVIIGVVFEILQIILFFKIWGMTNDVRLLKKDYFNEADVELVNLNEQNFVRNSIMGKKAKARQALLDLFMYKVESEYSSLKQDKYEICNGASQRVKEGMSKEDALKESITPYIENLKKDFARIDEEIPEFISRMKTFGDYMDFVKPLR
jgi:uncharacterized protein YwgA